MMRGVVICLPRLAAGLLAWLMAGPWAFAAALPTAPLQMAPATWIVYAEQTSRLLSAWLSSNEPAAQRLRVYLDRTRLAPDQSPAPVRLAIWIGEDGTLTRVEGALFTDPQPQADLRSLLVGRRLPAKPPVDMLQPVHIQLRLEAAPVDAGQAGGSKPPD